MASNLVQAKLWSQIRGMDRVGVDDPEAEQNLIREERTDATLFPADVQVQAALLATLAQTRAMQQQMGPPPGEEQMQSPEDAEMQTQAALMAAGGGQVAPPGMQAPEEQPLGGPPPANVEGAPGTPSQMLGQFQINEGEVNNRIVGQNTIQSSEESGV